MIDAKARHVFLTGPPAIGKSTAVINFVSRTRECAGGVRGFYTEECREKGERVGFDIVTARDSTRGPLARTGSKFPRVGKYAVDVAAFERLAMPELAPAALAEAKLLIVDEVGKMELFSDRFMPAVNAALDVERLRVVGTVPQPRYGRTIPEVEALKSRDDVFILTVSRLNRDAIPAALAAWYHGAST